MANLEIKTFDNYDVIRAARETEQAVITVVPANVPKRGTILGRVTATGAYGVYDPVATTGVEVPVGVCMVDVDDDATGSQPISVLLVGEVEYSKLVWVGGDGTTVDPVATPKLKDQLRTYGIIVRQAEDLSYYDNL